jgi:hypothetical protein
MEFKKKKERLTNPAAAAIDDQKKRKRDDEVWAVPRFSVNRPRADIVVGCRGRVG